MKTLLAIALLASGGVGAVATSRPADVTAGGVGLLLLLGLSVLSLYRSVIVVGPAEALHRSDCKSQLAEMKTLLQGFLQRQDREDQAKADRAAARATRRRKKN